MSGRKNIENLIFKFLNIGKLLVFLTENKTLNEKNYITGFLLVLIKARNKCRLLR